MNSPGSDKHIVFLSGGLYPGGTSEFVSNILEVLPEHGWRCSAMVAEILQAVGEDMVSRGLEVFGPYGSDGGLVEDSIGGAFRELARLRPRAVVASLGLEAFELLRIVPPDVLRVAMIQSDDPNVYATVVPYARWIDVVGCVSLRACERMIEIHPEIRPKVEYLPYGVRMAADPPPAAAKDEGSRIIYLGRLIEEQKRMSLQMEVMERTLEADPKLVWTLAGDGPAKAAMEARLARWGERVRFLGQIPNQQVPALLRGQDLFFLCSDYEGLPLSLLEAMGAGVVPVVSDLPSGIRQVVDESTGIRIDPADRSGYVNGVLDLARDPARRQTLAAECRLRVKDDYSIAAMGKRWAAMLERRLEGRPASCQWSGRTTVPPLLGFEGRWRFHPGLRPLRRIGKKLKQKLRDRA